MRTVLLLGVAGALGSMARYGLSALVGHWTGNAFPWGIFVVNVLGCFLFGAIWAGLGVFHLLDDAARIVLLTGFMGAFTTFSTFLFDSDVMLRNGDWGALALNLVGQIDLGLAALRAGAALAMRLV